MDTYVQPQSERDKTVAGNGNVREVFCIRRFMSSIRCRTLGESPEPEQQQAEVHAAMRFMLEVRGDDRARGFMRKKGRDNMKNLETKSCEEIMSTAYKPLEYCVDGLLTQGF